MTYFAEFCSIR